MNELKSIPQDAKEVVAKQHLQKKTSSARIPTGCKVFAVNRRTGECKEVRIDMSTVSKNEAKGDILVTPSTMHHKVTQSSDIFYAFAINEQNAIRKWNRVKHRLQLPIVSK